MAAPWFANPTYTGVAVGAATGGNHAETSSGLNRQIITYHYNPASFDPDGNVDPAKPGVFRDPFTTADVTAVNDLIAGKGPATGGTSPFNHPVVPVLHILGVRAGTPLDQSFPGQGDATKSTPSANKSGATHGLQDIANWVADDGSYVDTMIKKWVVLLKQLNGPVMTRMWHEMNDGGNAYSTNTNAGNTQANYVAAWKNVVNYIRAQVPNKIYFGWCQGGHLASPSFASQWWPGDPYSDWIGTDGYSNSTNSCPSVTNMGTIFTAIEAASARPIAWFENGLDQACTNRVTNINALLPLFKAHPQCKLWMVWDEGAHQINDTPNGSLAAYQTLGADPYMNPSLTSGGTNHPVTMTTATAPTVPSIASSFHGGESLNFDSTRPVHGSTDLVVTARADGAVHYLQRTGISSTQVVARFFINFASAPSVSTFNIFGCSGGPLWGVTSGLSPIVTAGVTTQTGAFTFSLNTWYRVDLRFDTSLATWKIDYQVATANGGTLYTSPTVTAAMAAGPRTDFKLGELIDGNFTFYVDDPKVTNSGYPLGWSGGPPNGGSVVLVDTGFEGASLLVGGVNFTTGSAAVDQITRLHGQQALVTPSSSLVLRNANFTATNFAARFFMRIDVSPTATAGILHAGDGSTTNFNLNLSNTGHLIPSISGSNGSASTTQLTPGSWYLLDVAGDARVSAIPASTTPPPNQAVMNVLIVPVERSAAGTMVGTQSDWNTQMTRVKAVWDASSYGAQTMSYAFAQKVTISGNVATNDTDEIRGQVLPALAASQPSVHWWAYDVVLYYIAPDTPQVTTSMGEVFIGGGVLGPTYPTPGGYTTPSVVLHELGHAMGLNHMGAYTGNPFAA